MHEHDQELIMALAEGTLDEAAAAVARDHISGCAECTRDLELQRLAIASLSELPGAYLTALESSRLHGNLKRELSLTEETPARRRRAIVWGRWMPAAALAVFVLVVVASLPSLLGGDDASETVALNEAAAETTAAASEEARAPMAEGGDTAEDMAQSLESALADEGMATTAAAEETTTTVAAAETTEALEVGATWYDSLSFLGELGLLERSEQIARLAGEGDDLRFGSDEAKLADPTIDACLEEISASEQASLLGIPAAGEPVVMGIVADDTGEELLLIAYVTEDIEETVFVSLRPADCLMAAVLTIPPGG